MANSLLIVRAAPGLSAALAYLFTKNGMAVALAARNINKRKAIFAETDAANINAMPVTPINWPVYLQISTSRSGHLTWWSITPRRGCPGPVKTWTQPATKRRSIPPVTAHFGDATVCETNAETGRWQYSV